MNGKIAKLSNIFLASLSLVAGVFLVSQSQNINEQASPSTSISFIPSSQEVHKGQTFNTQVEIDSGLENITGIDIIIDFDPNKINLNEIKPTSELTNFTSVIKNDINNAIGQARYTAFTLDKNQAISGTLKILSISGTTPQNSILGQSEIKFSSDTILIATNAGQNILTNTKSATIITIESEPNSCGGTCGSNNNCKSNLYCYQGYCRNPICSDDTNCDCTSSSTPNGTIAPTIKPTQKVATTKPIVITKTPSPSPIAKMNEFGRFNTSPVPSIVDLPDYEISPLPREENENIRPNKYGFIISDYLPTIFAIIGTISFIITILIIKRAINSKKPHILPPTNI